MCDVSEGRAMEEVVDGRPEKSEKGGTAAGAVFAILGELCLR